MVCFAHPVRAIKKLFEMEATGSNMEASIKLKINDANYRLQVEPRRRASPHRGFETVTVVYEGEVEHRDFFRRRRAYRMDEWGRRHRTRRNFTVASSPAMNW